MEKQLTPISQAIERVNDLKLEINPFNPHTEGYRDAYNECIEMLQSLLPAEKEIIENAFNAGFDLSLSGSYFFSKNFKQEP